MDSRRAWIAAVVEGPWLVLAALALLALRFIAPTLTAFLAVRGVDTTALDEFFSAYAGALPAVLLPAAYLILVTWPDRPRPGIPLGMAAALTLLALVLWAGEVDASLRLLEGGWVHTVFGVVVAAALLAYGWEFEGRIARAGATAVSREAFRALGWGFAFAYLVRSFQLLDYRTILGQPLPSGLAWLLVYAPTLALSALSIVHWIRFATWPAREPRALAVAFVPPLAVGALGAAASSGLAGFILANALTWGGSYAVFAPIEASLPLVGFAAGAFVSTAWAFRPRLHRASWRLLFGGVAAAALSGLLPFGGGLLSLSGIVLGLAFAARGIVTSVQGPRMAPAPSEEPVGSPGS